jgi:RNA-directed DNA polymerase
MREAHKWIADQQELIARAKRSGDLWLAENLGRKLVSSTYAHAVAVQTVATNIGARSPGLSNHDFRTNSDYAKMVEKLHYIVHNPDKYQASPLDRIYILKKDGKLRPISIPSYTDRCLQALYKLALEPISEEMADLSSYGFRPIRGVSWAVGRSLNAIANPLTKYSFCVEVDIMGCFDNISHDFITQLIPLIPKDILKAWLTCGYMERGDEKVYDTDQGVPQGGILSPLLANLTLDGLENYIKDKIASAKTGSSGSCFCRYADDMIVLVTTYQNAVITLDAIKEFLKIRGLQVKEAKTRIINTHESSFEFVGFEFSFVYRRNRKRHTARVGIPPKAICKLRDKINTIFRSNKEFHMKIDEVNSVIRGWGFFYRFAHNSIYVFRSLRYWIWKQYHSMCFRHTENVYDKANKTKINEIVMATYFAKHESYNTWPVIRDKNSHIHTLFDITTIEYTPPIYTNKAKNSYILEDREILDRISLKTKTRFNQVVLERWFGCCGLCRKRLDINPIPYELHHICPRRFGGKDIPKNLVPLCKAPCHKQVSSAIQTKDIEAILQYIGFGILELPYDFLESITPRTK